MLGAVHKNVLPILAVNSDNPMQPLLVYPYANKGNLKRSTASGFNRPRQRFMADCLQVSSEMSATGREICTVHSKFGGHGDSNFVGGDVPQQPVDLLQRSWYEELRVSKPLFKAKTKTLLAQKHRLHFSLWALSFQTGRKLASANHRQLSLKRFIPRWLHLFRCMRKSASKMVSYRNTKI